MQREEVYLLGKRGRWMVVVAVGFKKGGGMVEACHCKRSDSTIPSDRHRPAGGRRRERRKEREGEERDREMNGNCPRCWNLERLLSNSFKLVSVQEEKEDGVCVCACVCVCVGGHNGIMLSFKYLTHIWNDVYHQLLSVTSQSFTPPTNLKK